MWGTDGETALLSMRMPPKMKGDSDWTYLNGIRDSDVRFMSILGGRVSAS